MNREIRDTVITLYFIIRIRSRLENYERRRIMESLLQEREYRY